MIRLILLSFLGLSALFGKVNPLLERGAPITDISNTDKSRYVEVPFERISYTPSVHFVNNTLIYSEREVVRESCLIDYKNTESCPIDKKACDAQKEYAQGTSSMGEGYMSCSRLDPASYFDSSTGKCVLPADKAKVCQAYSGSYYDGGRDKCITLSYRPAPSTRL